MRESGMRISFMRLVSAVTLMTVAGVASAGEYACHVEIAKNKPAIALVDTDSNANAERAAAGATARAADGTRGPVERVVQCSDRLTGRFSDSQVQGQLEQLAR